MLISLKVSPQQQEPQAVNVLGWNSDNVTGYGPDATLMNISMMASLRFDGTNGTIFVPEDAPLDSTTKLPTTIPSGYENIWFVNDWSDEPIGAEILGSYVIRHNLPGGYTIDVSGGGVSNVTTVSSSRITFDFNSASILRVEVGKGSSGDMPAGWYIEVFKADHEALIDDATKDPLDARRWFRPEYLTLLQNMGVSEWRNMNWNDTNDAYEAVREIADIPTKDAKHVIGGIMPMELQVSFCNYLNCDLYWCQWTCSSDALVDHCATYIRDNLNSNLKCIVEWSNEVWNFSFEAWDYAAGVGLARPVGSGTPGAGTISGTEGEFTITGVGTNFVSEYSGLSVAYLAVGGRNYELDIPSLTATTATLDSSSGLRFSFSDAGWHRNTSSNSERFRGQTIEATRIADRFKTIFDATGQGARLVNVMGGQLAWGGGSDQILNPTDYTQDPLYIDPSTLFDAVVLNPYLGSDWFRDANVVQAAKDFVNVNDQAGFNNFMKQLAFETHPTFTDRQGLPTMVERFKTHKIDADAFGLDLRTYECGYHVIYNLTDADNDIILPAFQAYFNSAENDEVLTEWFNIIRTYTSGPLTTYKFLNTHGQSGTWGIYDNYSWYDGRVQWYENIGATVEPWWDTGYAPVQTRTVPAQSWTQGVDPEFSIYDYVSTNVTSYSGTVPSGMALNTSTGVLTGAPNTPGNNDFSVTASNVTGSVVVNVSVTVS